MSRHLVALAVAALLMLGHALGQENWRAIRRLMTRKYSSSIKLCEFDEITPSRAAKLIKFHGGRPTRPRIQHPEFVCRSGYSKSESNQSAVHSARRSGARFHSRGATSKLSSLPVSATSQMHEKPCPTEDHQNLGSSQERYPGQSSPERPPIQQRRE